MDNWILKQGELAPNRIAVDDGQTQLTFLELNQRTEALASQLDQAGALNSERVAILTQNSLDGYLFAMAILVRANNCLD